MGLLAYVNGIASSFGGTTTSIAVTDTTVVDVLQQILIEMKVTNVLLTEGLELEFSLDELREAVAESLT